MIDIVRYAKRAVELTSKYCNENDNCEHCEDRRMYLEDLNTFDGLITQVSNLSLHMRIGLLNIQAKKRRRVENHNL